MMAEDVLIARWSERFIAFLVDMVILIAVLAILGTILGSYQDYEWENINEMAFADTGVAGSTDWRPVGMTLMSIFIPLVYFAGMEYATGTTVGRRVMHLRVMSANGIEPPAVSGILLSNVGKSFLLVIDVILGLIFANENRQRIFSKWGGVIVVKVPKVAPDRKYRLD